MLLRVSRSLVLLAAMAAASAIAFSAQAQTVVVECKISQSVSHGVKKVYTDAERAQPDLRERFAFNVSRGRGCIISGGACDETMGRLYVEQDENTVTARGAERQVMLTYGFNRKSFYLLDGDDSSFSERDDCHEIRLDVVMP